MQPLSRAAAVTVGARPRVATWQPWAWSAGALATAVALTVAQSPLHSEPETPVAGRASFADRLKPRGPVVLRRSNESLAEYESGLDASANDGAADDVAPVTASLASTLDEAESEAASGEVESAFDERTGEINWDCPCLGGMADGPCGEEFKHAFSCFVFSEAEPKGIDCVGKFKLMQDCFRRHPEVYADEIAADEAAAADAQAEQDDA